MLLGVFAVGAFADDPGSDVAEEFAKCGDGGADDEEIGLDNAGFGRAKLYVSVKLLRSFDTQCKGAKREESVYAQGKKKGGGKLTSRRLHRQ